MLSVRAREKSDMAPTFLDGLVLWADVSKQLGVTEHTLRLWELAGHGPPPIRIGRRVYYRTDAVRKWLLRQEDR